MKPTSSWRPSAQGRERRGRSTAMTSTSTRLRTRPTSSHLTHHLPPPPREEQREDDDVDEVVRKKSSRGVSSTSSALSTPTSHPRRPSPHPSPPSPLARTRRRFAHTSVTSHQPAPTADSDRGAAPHVPYGDEGDVVQRVHWLRSHVARVEAENERQKTQIADLLQRQAAPPVTAHPSPSSSLPPSSAFSDKPLSSSAGLMFQWKRRESSLLSEVDDLRSSLHLSHRQHQALLDAHDRLLKERQQCESDRTQERAAHDSVVHQLRERVLKERSRRKMVDGELRALKRLREETAAQRLRLEVEQLHQSQEVEASADKSEALYQRLLTEQRQHEEAMAAIRQQLEQTLEEKAELEGQVKDSEDVIASLIPLETEVKLKTAELEDGRVEVAAFQQQIEALTTQCDQLTAQLAEAHSRVDAAHRTAADRDTDLHHAQQRLQDVEAELKVAKAELARAQEETAVTGEMLVDAEQHRRQQGEQLHVYAAHAQRVQRTVGALASALRLDPPFPPSTELNHQADTLRRVEESVAALMVSMAAKEAAVKTLEAEVRSTKASLRVQARRAKDVELQLWEDALAQREARHCHQVHKATSRPSTSRPHLFPHHLTSFL